MEPESALENNRAAWNRMAGAQHVLAKPATSEELSDPLKTIDGAGWLPGGIKGWNVLCLAAGGGRHGPLYAAAGANVTVVDLSPAMLELDREMSAKTGLAIRTIESSMDDLSMLDSATFDLVVHPVSTCYLPSLKELFPAVARVTRPGGLYFSQHKQPTNLQASLQTHTGRYVVEHAYYDRAAVPKAIGPNRLREPNTAEFVHSWDTLLGGICRAGFVIENVAEPIHADPNATNGSFGHRCAFIPPYLRIKARRNGQSGLVL